MPLQRPVIAALLAATLLCSKAAAAQDHSLASHGHAEAALTSLRLESDPFAPVHIVTSRKTYEGIRTITRDGVARRDSLGTPLVVAQIRAHQLSAVSEHVHQREKRCGGYFAFRTRAEAEAFIRSDRSAHAMQRSLLAYTIDNQATVDPWLPAVVESNLYNTINHLQSYQNRYYTSATGKSSAEWIRTTWQGLAGSRTDVTTELVACGTCSTQPSVILTIQGTDLPDEIVVLGAHLDSVNSSGGGNTQRAPGADDDASGIATLTEILRVALASGWQPKRTVKFMGYAAEEVGLRGSNAIAQSFRSANRNVVGVLQLDMTNYKSGPVEDMQLITDFSNADMKAFLVNLFDAYLAPLGLTRGTYTCGYGCSDHASWTSAGYPAAMMFEAGNANGYNPNIHTANDTLTTMGESAANSVKFAKLGLAFLGELGKTHDGTPPANLPPLADFSSTSSGLTVNFTDNSTDSDGTIVARQWNFGDGATSTATNPVRTYAAGGTYTVSLTVTDDDGATSTATASVTVTAEAAQTYENQKDYVVYDGYIGQSAVTVSGRSGNAPANTSVTVAVALGNIGLLRLDLVAPDGTAYNIHNRTQSGTRNLARTTSLDLNGEALNGVWTLRGETEYAGESIGYIDSWSITF